MFRTRLTASAACMAVIALLAGCSSSSSDGTTGTNTGTDIVSGIDTGTTTDTTTSDAVPPLTDGPASPLAPGAVSNADVLFPQIQGSWSYGCQLFDEEEPSEGYERSELRITGNEIVLDTEVFSDSNCVIPLARGFLQFGDNFQSYGTLVRPGGTADTSVGAVPYIDINFTRFTIDDEPLVSAVAAFFEPYSDFTIVYVDGNQMFLGNPDLPGQDGDTAQTRSLILDFDNPLTRL